MKNIEKNNAQIDKKEDLDILNDQLKGLKNEVLKGKQKLDNQKLDESNQKIQDMETDRLETERDLVSSVVDQLEGLKEHIQKETESLAEKNTIEKLGGVSDEGDSGYKKNGTKFKYKYKPEIYRDELVSKNIDVAASDVDKYIESVPGILGNWMRKIMRSEKK